MNSTSEPRDPGPRSDAFLAPGALLADRFLIERPVGRGADGVVYRAIDQRLGEAVALKTLRGDPENRQKLERLLRELQLARRVTHRNVCRLYDLVETRFADRHLLLLSMELLTGHTLRTLLHREGRLSAEISLAILEQVAAGLEEAHRAGVIHGDLSARNIFLETSAAHELVGRVVITDFGLARSILKQPAQLAGAGTDLHETTDEELAETLTEEIAGTPAYMAPEQLRGHTPTAASDVYAFSVLAYEMRSGKLPFEGKTSFETALQRLVAEPPLLGEVAPDPGDRWSLPLARGMARLPEDRPASAQRIVRSIRGDRTPTWGAMGSSPRQILRLVAWALGGLLVVLGGLLWLWPAAPPPALRATPATNPLVATSNTSRALGEASDASLAGSSAAAEALASRRLVVLPFEDDGSAAGGYLAHAVAQQLRQRLGQMNGLGVFSPASADVIFRQLRQESQSRDELARDFGLRYLVHGEVTLSTAERAAGRSTPEQVSVSVSLRDLAQGGEPLSASFQRPLSDAFGLQARVAEHVSAWLQDASIEHRGGDPAATDEAPDLQAYQNWARGLQFFYGTYGIGGVSERRAGLERARTLFDSAVARDPSFHQAAAWSALCDLTESLLPGVGDAQDDLVRSAEAKARRALAGSPESTEANAVLGFASGSAGDLARAEEHFARALDVSPGSALVHGLRAQLLERAELWELAAEEAALAAELDPFNPMMLQLAAGSFLVLRAYPRADELYATAIERFPEHPLFYAGRAVNTFYWRGDTRTARELLDQVPASGPGDYLTAWFYMVEGAYEAALDELDGIAEGIWDAELYQPKELLRAFCLRRLGREPEAREALRRAAEVLEARGAPPPDDPRVGITRATIEAMQGNAVASRRALEQATVAADLRGEPLASAALVQAAAWAHTLLGDFDAAFTYLSALFEGPANISREALRRDPRWEALRSDPRFSQLLAQAAAAERRFTQGGRERGFDR